MTQIIEIGIEIENQEDWAFLEQFLLKCKFPFYFLPPRNPPLVNLIELEIECEEK